MKIFLMSLMVLSIFLGCSTKPEVQKHRVKAKSSLSSYQDAFLNSDETLARFFYADALKEAKKSINFDILAKVYLSRCAMQSTILLSEVCKPYYEIERFVKSAQTKAYAQMLLDINRVQVFLLPAQYQGLAKSIQEKNGIFSAIEAIKNPLSKLIAASLALPHVFEQKRLIKAMIEHTSYYGWKRPMVTWLSLLYEKQVEEGLEKEAQKSLEQLSILLKK